MAQFIIAMLALILSISMMVSIYRRKEDFFNQPTDRVLWFIVVFFTPLIGPLIYMAWAHQQMQHHDRMARHRRMSEITKRPSPRLPGNAGEEFAP